MGQELNDYNLDYEECVCIYMCVCVCVCMCVCVHTHIHSIYIYFFILYICVFPNNEIDEVEWLRVLEKNSKY